MMETDRGSIQEDQLPRRVEMKTKIGRILSTLLLTASMLLAAAVPVQADESDDNEPYFDFGFTYATVGAGESIELYLCSSNYYSVYEVGNTSEDTRMIGAGGTGDQTVTIQVGEDETADLVTFWFYPREGYNESTMDDYKAAVQIRINPKGSASAKDVDVSASQISVLFGNGSVGTVTTNSDANVALLSSEEGYSLAAFAIKADGEYQQFTVDSVSKGFIYCTAPNTTSTPTAEISMADKQQAAVYGIVGLVVNGIPVLF